MATERTRLCVSFGGETLRLAPALGQAGLLLDAAALLGEGPRGYPAGRVFWSGYLESWCVRVYPTRAGGELVDHRGQALEKGLSYPVRERTTFLIAGQVLTLSPERRA